MDDINNISIQHWAVQGPWPAANEAYLRSNQHLSWEQLLELEDSRFWEPQMPHTLSWTGFQSSANTQPLTKTRSEGRPTPYSRVRLPRNPSDGPYSSRSNHVGRKPPVSARQNDADGNKTLSPHSRPGLKLRPPNQQPKLVKAETYEPGEFLSKLSEPCNMPPMQPDSLANGTPAIYYPDHAHLSVNNVPMLDRSSFDGASPPSTPAITEASTLSSEVMTRNSSVASCSSGINNLLTQDFNMLRMNSNMSNISYIEGDIKAIPDLPFDFGQEAVVDYSFCHQSDPISFVAHVQDTSTTSSFDFSSNNLNEFTSHLSTLSESTLAMTKSCSTQSSESDSSSQSRSSRCQERIRQASKCPIAPKVDASKKLSPTTRIVTIETEDGSLQRKAAISRRTVYQRPQRPKLLCEFCNDYPDGFRGDHELQRHTNRAHPTKIRKVWICTDVLGDGSFLASCKACRSRKRYGAYYNAAAHLRRTHFNPRKRGRKAKTEAEKRGGKAGGNWPPMDILKDRWMREIEEVVDDTSPVDFDNNTTADSEDEQQGEQGLLGPTTEPSSHPPVSLSPNDYDINKAWLDSTIEFTNDGLTNIAYDESANISPACYPFDPQQALGSPEMEAFIVEDLQPRLPTFYFD